MDLSQARLLFVITGTGVGGSEKVLAGLALAMRTLWAEVGVCSLKPLGHFGRDLARQGLAVFTCGMGDRDGFLGLADTVRALPALGRVVRTFRPTLVHAFLFRAGLLARLPVVAQRVPRLLVSVRTLERRSLAAHLLDRCTAGAVDRFTAVSEAARQVIARRSGIPLSRIERIPNGAGVEGPSDGAVSAAAWRLARRDLARRDLAARTGPLPGTLVGSLGRLDPIKGYATLLEAAARLGSAGAPAADGPGVVLFGDGPDRADLEALVSRPPLRGRAFILGEDPDAARLLPAIDLFVLPSLAEGMSNALLEAMAEGIPVVATRVGGNAEVIEDGRSGLLVEPGDAAGLSGALAGLLADPDSARRLGLEGRERVRRAFSTQGMLDAYHDLYRRLLEPL